MLKKILLVVVTGLVLLIPQNLIHAQVGVNPSANPVVNASDVPVSTSSIPTSISTPSSLPDPGTIANPRANPLVTSSDAPATSNGTGTAPNPQANPQVNASDVPATSGTSASRPATQTGSFLQIGLPANHGLPGSSGPQSLLNTVINNVLNFLALIAIVAFIYAGVQLVMAQGKADAIGSAKNNIINIIIGFAIVMLAWSGVNIVLRFIGFTH